MSSDCSWKCQWTGHTWWWWGACSREKGRHAQNNACQNLPGDNEVSSRDVYPQIVETSQVCGATVVMTSKVEPCHVEPCRPATRFCNLFCTQLAASVDLSILVLYGHIFAVRRQCAQHYSGSVVAETLSWINFNISMLVFMRQQYYICLPRSLWPSACLSLRPVRNSMASTH